eukprot:CAMPEP_0177253152 /NCGR_PEP_ID=MMETSP0367-20130122/54989_1 /TAXON_ID=447022 ORGANISM="Scrippsiella hangoei-like, Strain SHHI-4" /NCGR_SAMPLE_ID=MMETSP0367 /ASSEMBLY_ACC=CAM_ASM_000362 /LENGTH=102 /DNA_ID=CAMNT_0018706417 /DNA_START=62 /DNA_END=368 /DNA_ORIENTATION=-
MAVVDAVGVVGERLPEIQQPSFEVFRGHDVIKRPLELCTSPALSQVGPADAIQVLGASLASAPLEPFLSSSPLLPSDEGSVAVRDTCLLAIRPATSAASARS